jgi:hypothetical protein
MPKTKKTGKISAKPRSVEVIAAFDPKRPIRRVFRLGRFDRITL